MCSAAIAAAVTILPAEAQTTLTLKQCRDMAVQSSKELDQARVRREMAEYDVKIARSYYLPSIDATGAYIHNFRDISLISDDQSEALRNAGTLIQEQINAGAANAGAGLSAYMNGWSNSLMQAIQSNPQALAEYMGSPMWQTFLKSLQSLSPSQLSALIPDISAPLNAIGTEIDNALHPDMSNVFVGAVTVKQPVFAGGKILYSNQMADLAGELAASKYDMEYADIIVEVDQAYWQIISIANKKKLAESYAELLHRMERDVELSIAAGVATESDALQIKVKANEADMLFTRSANGLELARMLLCKRIGLPLDTDILLADETLDDIPQPGLMEEKPLERIFEDRPETRSLYLASQIYDRKAKISRADLMPTVAITGSYIISNPNLFNGFQKSWNGGMPSIGAVVSVPLFHGGQNLNRYRKAQTEARLYTCQLDDTKDLIRLQVTQQRKLLGETLEKLNMAEANLSSAEENLRSAMVGFEAGVVETNTVLGAQTAWLSAHSEYIDAEIELQIAAATLNKAEGNIREQK